MKNSLPINPNPALKGKLGTKAAKMLSVEAGIAVRYDLHPRDPSQAVSIHAAADNDYLGCYVPIGADGIIADTAS